MSPENLIPALIDDSARYIHLLAVAIGLGASFVADFTVARNLNKTVTTTLLDTLHSCHRIVWLALLVMWLSGLVLIYLRTGFLLEDFSPKLYTKILVVSVLTVNAILIGAYAMPVFERMKNRPPLALPARQRRPLACMAGVSTLSWLLALALGSSRVLAQSSAEVFYILIPTSYGICLLTALATARMLRSTPQQPNSPARPAE